MYFGQQTNQQGFQRGAPMDSVAARKKEEQRRRQQEYAQALAQQVAQREQQRQRDRELDRQAGVVSTQSLRRGNGFNNPAPPPPPTANPQQRGFFDGFGQDGPNSRTNFARGQQQQSHPQPTPQWQQQQQEPQQYQQQFVDQNFQHQPQWQPGRPPSAMNYAPPQDPFSNQPSVNQYGGNGNSPSRWNSNPAQTQWPTPEEYHPYQPGAPFAPARMNEFGAQQPFHSGAGPFESVGAAGFHGNGFAQVAQSFPNASSPTREPAIRNQQDYHQPQQQMGRRVRTDISGVGNAGGENRKMQQQIELQNALQRQIDEKNRQKLEEKRRLEEEDRKEMERLASEQRAQQAQQEREREEKRRRAEEETIRAQQAAAAVAAADQRAKAENQQRLRKGRDGSPVRGSPPKDPFTNTRARLFQDSPQAQPPEQSGPFPRAHLFQDSSASQLSDGPSTFPPIALTQQPPVARANNFFGDPGGNQSPTNRLAFQQQQPYEHFHQISPQERDRQLQYPHGQEEGFSASPGRSGMEAKRGQQVPSAWGSREIQRGMGGNSDSNIPPIDPTVLMRQYNDMRQELARQQQLMDQLRHAQSELQHKIQAQQQQQVNASPESPVPTLTDLDQLRDELREELEQREQHHRKELEALRRAHQQQQQQPSQAASPFREQTALVPISFEQTNRIPGGSLLRSSSERIPAPQLVRPLDTTSESLRRQPQPQPQSPTRRSGGAPVGILKSLECESKLVYFNRSIVKDKPDDRGGKRVVLEPLDEDEGDDSSSDRDDDTDDAEINPARDSLDELNASSISIRPVRTSSASAHGNQESMSRSSPLKRSTDNNRVLRAHTGSKSPTRRSQLASAARLTLSKNQESTSIDTWDGRILEERGEDSLEFFVKSYPPTASSRYGYNDVEGLSSFSLTSRSAILDGYDDQEDDNDDGDEASMDGDQLEAIFQRNVRRHEILLGFQQRQSRAMSSFDPVRSPTKAAAAGGREAWAELHHQLERNQEPKFGANHSTKQSRKSVELALIGSSRWMPSSLA